MTQDALRGIFENPLLREAHARQRAELRAQFAELARCPHDHFLFLRRYSIESPQRFHSQTACAALLAWLEERDKTSRSTLAKYISVNSPELNRAFLHLEEINSLEWHDHFEEPDDYEHIRFVDQKIHPTYLRLAESVLTPLCRIIAHFLRVDRGKSTDGLELWSIMEEIEKTPLRLVTLPYRPIVRNAIAHGGITFLDREIRYRDKKGNEEKHRVSEIVRTFDDLLDVCNALTLALTLFLLSHLAHGYELPQQLLLTELREETKAPWWEIVGCTASEITGLNQLIVYARPRTSDYGLVQFSTFQSGVLVEEFAPGYDRYFFSIRSASSWPGWAVFDGKKLRALREKQNAVLEDYKGVQESLFYYVPRRFRAPVFIRRLQAMALSARMQWPNVVGDMKRQLGWPVIRVRNTEIHRNAWGCVVNGSVYLRAAEGEVTREVVRRFRKRIVQAALRDARSLHTTRLSPLRFLPLGFARISVFRKDYRRRRLSNFGLDRDLVCTIQVKRIKRIQSPDILGSTVEKSGSYRICWNRAWLEELH